MTRTETLASRIALWAPPFVLMAVIFVLSAQPDLGTGLGTIDLVARKLVHMAEYALLFFLWWRALRTIAPHGWAIPLALAISIGYAISDEFHQSFVEGRNGNPVDVAIDTLGASLAAFAVHRRGR